MADYQAGCNGELPTAPRTSKELLKLLRAKRDVLDHSAINGYRRVDPPQNELDAADEIERLQRENARLRDALTPRRDECGIEWRERALRAMRDVPAHEPLDGKPCDPGPMGTCCYGGRKLRGDCASCAAWRPDPQPGTCIHPWEHIGVSADGHAFCGECRVNLVKDPPWRDVQQSEPDEREDPCHPAFVGEIAQQPPYAPTNDEIERHLIVLRYDTCEKLEECQPCQGIRRKSIEIIERLRAAQPSNAVPDDVLQDARRYRRLQILGVAPGYSKYLEQGLVMRFQTLDAYVDADMKAHPERGDVPVPTKGEAT